MHRITRSCVLFLWIHTLTFVKSQECTLQSFLKSREYDKNFDTSTMEDTYPGGTQLRVGCVVGFSGFYKLICVEGDWQHRGTRCQPRSCGHPGDAQFADFHLSHGDDFVFGSQVTYTCHKGYQMVSRKNYRNCQAGGWDGSVPVCEAQSCQPFTVGDNVMVNGDIEGATYGNVVRFSCRSNTLVLYGSPEMYCDEDGQWVGTSPKCEAVKCTVPDIQNGYVPGGSQAQRVYNEHEILHFACDPLYKRTEDRPSACTKIGQKAEFSPTPACEQIKCKLDQLTPTGTTYEPRNRNLFLPGDKLTVRCGDRHYFSHFRETSAEVTCQENGQWSATPVCREVICEKRHPHVTWPKDWRQIKLQQSTSYKCGYGYKRTSVNGQATCTRDGWTPNPLCEEITCNRVSVENAVIEGNTQEYKFNDKATYHCKEGYTGNPTRTCKEHGWTGTSGCRERECGAVTVENADIVGNKHNYKYNQIAYYRCHKGFTGRPTRICKARGLTGQSECAEVTCKKEGFDYAQANDRHVQFRYGQDLEYTCIGGRDGGFTRTCGENGWTGSTDCSTCPKPRVNNGFVDFSSADPNTVHFACNKGFKRFTKGWWGKAKCEDRQWVGLEDCIEEQQCGQFPVIPNGAVSHQQNRAYENRDLVQIECNEGYRRRTNYLTCEQGSWTSGRTSLETICESYPGNCKPPPVVENAVIETSHQNEYRYGSHVTYKCRDNYMLERDETLYCTNGNWQNRNWQNGNVKCSRVCDELKDETLALVSADYRGERYRTGQEIHYKCVASQESGTATCENGEWIKSVKCEGVCDKLKDETLEIPAHYRGERYRNGQEIHYKCVASQESGTATCEDGEWIKSVKCEAPPDPAAPKAVQDSADPEAVPDPADPEAVPDPAAPKAVPDPADPKAVQDPADPKAVPDPADPEAVPDPADPKAVPDPAAPEAVPDPAAPEASQAEEQ